MGKYNDIKEEIKHILNKEIKEYKSDLAQVKSRIEENFHKSLSTIDDAYIERKYIKLCAKFWLQETTNFLTELAESKNGTVIIEIFNSLNDIKGLSQIPNPLKQLKYYTLFIKHYKLVRKENEKIFIRRFKQTCLEQLVAFRDSAEKELVLLETLVIFLNYSKSLKSIIAELELKDFCRGDLSFDELISNIVKLEVDIYDENLIVLKEAAEGFKEENDPFLIDQFKKIIGAYIKPVEMQERRIDDRLVVEVTGNNIVVNEILRQLESTLLENPNIEEVRFVGADIIHIDTNFESEVWYGKNVVVLTKIIKVHGQVIWDVSGRGSNHTYPDNAGTGGDGHGKQGKDGYLGESGGNVLVLTEKLENSENFTIISNGGKGSKGQDGGNGINGKDGIGITKREFYAEFPSVIKTFPGIPSGPHDKTLGYRLMDKTSDAIDKISVTKKINWFHKGDRYVEAKTSEGNEIVFSYYTAFLANQAFLLYKGSLGLPGGHGGEYGLGGQGGYAGEITVINPENNQKLNIIKEVKQGKEGEKGQGGLYGSHGKNGWDMGYMDYQLWKETRFLGQDQKSKCTLQYYKDKSRGRIWCPYKNKYAVITAAKIEGNMQTRYEERRSTRFNNHRQHHAQAVRKKNISQRSILANYSHHFSSIERTTLQNLQSNLENTKQPVIKKQEQQESQTTELRIKRHVKSSYQGKNKHYIATAPSTTYGKTTDAEDLIGEIKNNSLLLLDNRSQLKNIELSLSQLNQLFLVFETLKGNPPETRSLQNNTKLQDIEKLLIDKYRLATLREIAKQLPLYQEVTDNPELTPESIVRYLIEKKEKNNNISHDILGTLDQYLYENNAAQREKISKFCREELQNSNKNHEILKRSLKMYIFEVGNSKEVHSCIKKYYDEHKEFLEKRKHSLNISIEALENELSQPRHAEVFDLWIKSIHYQSVTSKLEEEIQKDDNLKALYNRFNNQLKQEYDWSKCCKDQAILKEYNDYIREKGPLSESYRELLACVFNLNIRLYVEDQYNSLSLQDNHNSLSKTAIHVLYRANEFTQLDIDENYLKLGEERKRKDDLYAKILTEIKSFKQKLDFDSYLKNKAFLSNNRPLEDEQSFNEEEVIEKIIEYFPEAERQQIKGRLDKISAQYIGQQEILHNILKRFSSDGRHVFLQELYCLINAILNSVTEDKKELNIFCWIVAAYPQKSWIDELILLQVENYFRKTLTEKPEWRNYLTKIENKDILLLFNLRLDQYKSSSPISTQCIEDTLRLLSNIPNETVNLGGLGLSEWHYALKEKYWTYKLTKLVDWQKDDLPTATYYLLSIENTFGTDLVEKFLKALEEKEKISDIVTNILSNFYHEKWNLSEEELKTLRNCSINEWVNKMEQKFTAEEKDRNVTQLVELMKGNALNSKEISDNLSKIEDSVKNICQNKYVITEKSIGSFTEDNIKNWVKKFQDSIGEKTQNIKETHKEMLAVIDKAIELKRGFKLRDTQKLTVLTLLTNDRSTLAQVSTGEGKTLIIVAESIIKALCGEKVDIITSSSVLAKRDAEGNRDIYNLFGINVSHNCSEDIEKRKEAYSGNQVIYGDLSNFQRDYLLDKFYGKNILGNRNFVNVIVDEVDSMLLDKGNNMLYLSHDLAGLDKLASVYIYIWQWINRPATDHEELSYAFDTKAIKEAVISDLYGLVTIEDIEKLGSNLSKLEKNIIWGRLVKTKILDNKGKLLKESIDDNELNKILLPEFNCKDRLHYLLKECIEREKFINVPNHLRPFIEQHLESWIDSAKTAFFMKTGEDYVVDVDRTGTSPDLNPNITILDRDTGTDQANSQWDEALHQFLQLKHGCKLSLQSLKAVFISNVSFFKLYSNLYGLTGTLGSQRERDLLQDIHRVDYVTIPTAKSKQFHEEKPILCTDKDEWIRCILSEAKKLIEEKKRSLLIICETVNDVETLYKAFGGKGVKHVHTYTRDYEELDKGFETVNKELGQGQIIIATNLAGRGTDIKITKELRKAEGLHVCLTYLPNNIRIEQQAFGRTARSGTQGSGQLIIMDSKGHEYSNSKILDLKKERDEEELHRISEMKAYYDTQITIEEKCFEAFKEQYEQMKKDLDDKEVPTEVKEILLQSCFDKWTFWLDEHSKYVRDSTEEQDKRNLYKLLDKFISRLKNLDTQHDSTSWLAWVKENPVHTIKLGKYLSQNKKHKNDLKNAIELFDEVIKKEPYFSEVARYYKAFALIQKVDFEQKPLKEEDKKVLKEFKQELREAAKLLNKHSEFAFNAASIVGKIKKNNNESIIQIDAYEEQQESLANLYYIFSRSIDDILGHSITSQSFVNMDIKEGLAEDLYDDLIRNGVLKKPTVKENISEDELKTISFNYGVSANILRDFLSKHKEINDKEFQKELKEKIQLPGRNKFWKSLIEQNVLSQEVKYVITDNEKFREVDPSLLDFLTKKVDTNRLNKQTLESNNEQIFLNAEWISQQKNNGNIFIKKDFIATVGKDNYQMLKDRGVLSFNRKAHIDKSKNESVSFSQYDSITLEDFSKIDITKSEAEKILVELVKQNVVEKKDNSENSAYRLKTKFDEIGQVKLSFCPVYENAVKWLLSTCFTYRIALQKIESQLEEKNSPIHLLLMTKPHQNLILELLEQHIIKPVTVANIDKDLIKQKIKEALNKRQLTKKDIIENVIRTLEQSRSLLEALDVPDGKLKSLTELYAQGNFANIEEVRVFSLNGLGQLLQFEEKKWTLRMILNTVAVIAIGISQIVIGAVIESFSAGAMTHVGSAFISEGVNDFFFAAGALTSGYFSWKDYGQQKLESLALTALTAGIGAVLSKGIKVLRFGHKLAAPNFEFGKKVAEISGTQLIKTAGYKVVGKEVAKRIMLKAAEGVSFGLASAGVDTIIENYLQTLCDGIGSAILSNIERKIESHTISASLEKIYKTLGEQSVRKIIIDLTNSVFNERNCQQFMPTAKKIADSVIQGIADASSKRSMAGNKLIDGIGKICKVVVWLERATHISEILYITDSFLDSLDQKIKDKLSKNENTKPDLLTQKPEAEGDYEVFKKEMTDQWKLLLRENVGQIIAQHIVSPILKRGVNHLVRYVGKKVQEKYQSYKESEYSERFEKLKQEYKEELHREQQSFFYNTSTIENHITEKYHKDLLKLMTKTRNPDLFANILTQNIPMDMTCVQALPQVIDKVLKLQVTFIVERSDGLRQEFPSRSEGPGGIFIELKLENNHFEFGGNSISQNNRSRESENNCLYEAIMIALPRLSMTPDQFRAEIVSCIKQDPEIRDHIQQGWHRLPISLGAFGGAKKRSRLSHDDESSSIDLEEPYEEYQYRERTVSEHLISRFTRFFRFGGIIQRVSEQTKVNRYKVVKPGRSLYQDQRSHRGRDIHAAHVIRAGAINSKILIQSEQIKKILVNFLGHTHNVPKYANVWHGVGGDIDRFQEDNLDRLHSINFRGRLTAGVARRISSLKMDCLAVLDSQINRGELSDGEKSELIRTRETLNSVTIEFLFEKGNNGYLFKGMDAYR